MCNYCIVVFLCFAGIPNENDNCPIISNINQTDSDQDGFGDECDNCPDIANPSQSDIDEDLIGDACDDDIDFDGDGIQDTVDNCKVIANSDQLDTDMDGIGDLCDDDIDNDGVPNVDDNCPIAYNPPQTDANRKFFFDFNHFHNRLNFFFFF